jgi:hypothetical protein
MPITPEVQKWLQEAGYEHYCFISWPHIENDYLAEAAMHIRDGLIGRLSDSIPRPSVFLDLTSVPGGAIWRTHLTRALCRSITMVAICVPIYYDATHRWCGLEWAAMDVLNTRRISRPEFNSIIPVIVRTGNLPAAVSRIQPVDISGVITSGSYFRTNEFRRKLEEIMQRIESVADALARQNSTAGCDQFKFPKKSAFAGCTTKPQPFPFTEWK